MSKQTAAIKAKINAVKREKSAAEKELRKQKQRLKEVQELENGIQDVSSSHCSIFNNNLYQGTGQMCSLIEWTGIRNKAFEIESTQKEKDLWSDPLLENAEDSLRQERNEVQRKINELEQKIMSLERDIENLQRSLKRAEQKEQEEKLAMQKQVKA